MLTIRNSGQPSLWWWRCLRTSKERIALSSFPQNPAPLRKHWEPQVLYGVKKQLYGKSNHWLSRRNVLFQKASKCFQNIFENISIYVSFIVGARASPTSPHTLLKFMRCSAPTFPSKTLHPSLSPTMDESSPTTIDTVQVVGEADQQTCVTSAVRYLSLSFCRYSLCGCVCWLVPFRHVV